MGIFGYLKFFAFFNFADTLYYTESRGIKILSNIIYKTENKIYIKKGFSQTGFTEKELPKFNGLVLDYPLFICNCSIDVIPNCLKKIIKLKT